MITRPFEEARAPGRVALLLALSSAALSCDRATEAPTVRALPPGVVARVGSIDPAGDKSAARFVDVTADRVARIAAAQRVSISEARDIAVHDALLAQGAIARGLDRAPGFDRDVARVLARAMLHRLLADARRAPPTDAELQAAASRRWLDVDRPEGSRVVHAVVRFDAAKDDDAKKAAARALAESIHAAVAPIAERAASMPLVEGAPLPSARQIPAEDPDPLSGAFRKAASAVPAGSLEVVVEPLPTVASDGRVLGPGNEALDPTFSRAAAAIPARGGLAPVTLTSFGFHVILLLERTPARVLTGDDRAARLFSDIVNERARAAEKKLLATLRPQGAPSPDALGLIELPRVDP